ncbi:DUF4331 domain-containing protein [Streptomyces sp. NBC_01304]|uniref:DUF4331 domain-containing protein n=1 Tax=Streptomyces sp. NBC_01304 TaxID=2903818 RepID=UPI002E0F2C67|nr:DUF4331 domain-containing protein [Streptomyces sp. NBC_01304]
MKSTLRFRVPYALAFLTGTSLLAAATLAGPGTGVSAAGSHIDAPVAMLNPDLNGADLFMFTSPDDPDSVTIMSTYQPVNPPKVVGVLPPRLFRPDAHYDLNIDSNGDARPDVTYRWTFRTQNPGLLHAKGVVDDLADTDRLERQTYQLEEIRPGGTKVLTKNQLSAPSRLSRVLMPNYEKLQRQATVSLPGGIKAYAGPAADPFIVDIRTFAMLKLGVDLPAPVNPLSALGSNVIVTAVQVPKKSLALGGNPSRNPVIGAWATASAKTLKINNSGGGYVQMSRMGHSFLNEALGPDAFLNPGGLLVGIPGGVADQFNGSKPHMDSKWRAFVDMVKRPLGPKLASLGHLALVPAPKDPREDLWQVFTKGIGKKNGPIPGDLNAHNLNADVDADKIVPGEMIRLNMSTPVTKSPKKYGWLVGDKQGYPNGRRLTDDATVVFGRLLMGEPQGKGAPLLFEPQLGPFPPKPKGHFPYVELPSALF